MTLLYITAALSIGLGVAALIAGEVGLSGTGRESQLAFYAADYGAECALYWDLKHPLTPTSVFTIPPPQNPFTIDCAGEREVAYNDASGLFAFSVALDNGTCADVTVEKVGGGGARITAQGHNICPGVLGRRVERGLEVTY